MFYPFYRKDFSSLEHDLTRGQIWGHSSNENAWFLAAHSASAGRGQPHWDVGFKSRRYRQKVSVAIKPNHSLFTICIFLTISLLFQTRFNHSEYSKDRNIGSNLQSHRERTCKLTLQELKPIKHHLGTFSSVACVSFLHIICQIKCWILL